MHESNLRSDRRDLDSRGLTAGYCEYTCFHTHGLFVRFQCLFISQDLQLVVRHFR